MTQPPTLYPVGLRLAGRKVVVIGGGRVAQRRIPGLLSAGAKVEHGFVVFHYGIFQQSIDNMNALGMTLHYLTDWWAVLQTAKDLNYFDTETLSSVEAFLNGPDAWANANMDRMPRKEQA